MHVRSAPAALAAVLLLVPRAAPAQHDHHGAPAGGAVGTVAFETSCAPAADAAFRQGVTLLHSFWYEEAERSFRRASEADPRCAIAWWGVAMSRLHPLWQAPGEADLAAGLQAVRAGKAIAATPREQAYLDAMAAYWDAAARPHRERLLAWETATGEVHRAYPGDSEAAVFHALAIIAVANALPADAALERNRRAGAILEPIFRRQPAHPGLAHYLVHAYDAPALATQGVEAARRYARIAPAVPHARHMPSHTFTRLGMWDESIDSNRGAAEAGRRYEVEQRLPGAWDQRLHALDYLAYAYLQQGRRAEARRVVDDAAAVTVVEPRVSQAADYALAAIPARWALERGDWAGAARLAVRPSPAFPATEAITRFARGLGAARTGNAAQAAREAAALDSLHAALVAQQQGLWAGAVGVQRQALGAWIAWEGGDRARALELSAAAADAEARLEKHPVTPGSVLPAAALHGELLLRAGRPADALRAYESGLSREPNRAALLAGAVRAAEAAGNTAAAVRYATQYRRLMARADHARAASTR
ncbi:MAG: hypothetical protein ACJ8GN_27890 [Longimicrobiaceae bacterium]